MDIKMWSSIIKKYKQIIMNCKFNNVIVLHIVMENDCPNVTFIGRYQSCKVNNLSK